jgi:hypothetical protein
MRPPTDVVSTVVDRLMRSRNLFGLSDFEEAAAAAAIRMIDVEWSPNGRKKT